MSERMKLKHINGDTYEGEVTHEDAHRVWLTTSTRRVLQIMKADIVKDEWHCPDCEKDVDGCTCELDEKEDDE